MPSTPNTKGFHCRSRQYSNFKFGCHNNRHHHHDDDDIECSEPDDGLIISESLLKDSITSHGILNCGQEDEMKIIGYRRSVTRTIICYICIILTLGLLRLFMHWWRTWLLLATHSPCPLDIAEKVLIREEYKGKHTILYVKDVITFNADTAKKMKEEEKQKWKDFFPIDENSIISDNEFKISVHFSSGEFRHSDSIRIFRCKQLRYVWDSQTQTFRKLKGLDVNISSTYLHQRKGLSLIEHNARRLIYGLNKISIPVKGVFVLLFLEVLNPIYCFQIFSVCLWISYNYYYYACILLCMSAYSIIMAVFQTKKNQRALRSTVQDSNFALIVFDNGKTERVETTHLVPGDTIEIPSSGCTMHCDAVLLSGNCILDESMLTGESVPVTKTPLPIKRDLMFDVKEHSRHMLFCGTKVIQTRYIGSEKVLAVVINTGNSTVKGELIRSILYPPPVDYKFEKDSYKFIALLGLIAGIGFIYTLVTKILRHISASKIAIESLDLITIAVPPALPAAMTAGRYSAQGRLKKKNIYCISPRSIIVSGSINCVCFDKTGTLTEDGLDMWGVVPKSETNQFQMPLKQIERLPLEHFLFGMVTCHSITIINGEMKGDPLDLKMFESTGWELEEANVADDNKYDLLFPTIVRQPKSNRNSVGSNSSSTKQLDGSDEDLVFGSNDIGIVREFPFTSSLQRMSVITRKLTDNHFNVYCKGSPEMIQTLCRPETIPENYSNQLDYYAQQGYRIIAIAYKPLDKKMTYAKIQKIGRDKIECDLEFQGFVILENRLKPDTTEVIKNLIAADIRTIMVTGDNILTALSVAKKCGMVSHKQSIITVNCRQNPLQPEKYEIFYNLTGVTSPNVQTPNGNGDLCSSFMTNSNSVASLETIATWTHQDPEIGLTYDDMNGSGGGGNTNDNCIKYQQKKKQQHDSCGNFNNYRFAMVGKTWSIINEHFPELLPKFLTRGTIFARMSPEHKQSLILELQNLGYYVAMCGDGANDCGALKVAHTGISLSEAESSVASPFTSRTSTIACVPNVIKEGRATLVTSVGIFKYMATYSLVQFVSVLILYSIDSNLTDFQFLYIDLCLISVLAFLFGKTEAYDGPLVKGAPLNSLISLSPIISLILHLITAIIFQVFSWYHVQSQPWFEPFKYNDTGKDMDLACNENYTIFVITCFQYIILALVFSKGAPYRKPILSNYLFLLIFILNLSFVIYLCVMPIEFIKNNFELKMPPSIPFRLQLVGLGILNFIVSLFIETVIIEYLLSNKMLSRFHNINKSKRKYLAIENELRNNYKWPPLSCYQNDINAIINVDEKSSPVSYAEIGAEHGVDLGQQYDQNNSVLNRFFEKQLDDELQLKILNPKNHENSNDVKHNENNLNSKCTVINNGNIVKNDSDDDDDDLSNIDSESDYESIQNDLKYNNGSQENVITSKQTSTTLTNSNNDNLINKYRNQFVSTKNEIPKTEKESKSEIKNGENGTEIEMILKSPSSLSTENNHLIKNNSQINHYHPQQQQQNQLYYYKCNNYNNHQNNDKNILKTTLIDDCNCSSKNENGIGGDIVVIIGGGDGNGDDNVTCNHHNNYDSSVSAVNSKEIIFNNHNCNENENENENDKCTGIDLKCDTTNNVTVVNIEDNMNGSNNKKLIMNNELCHRLQS